MELACVPTDRPTDKENVVHVHSGALHSHQGEQNDVLSRKVGGPGERRVSEVSQAQRVKGGAFTFLLEARGGRFSS